GHLGVENDVARPVAAVPQPGVEVDRRGDGRVPLRIRRQAAGPGVKGRERAVPLRVHRGLGVGGIPRFLRRFLVFPVVAVVFVFVVRGRRRFLALGLRLLRLRVAVGPVVRVGFAVSILGGVVPFGGG